MSRRHSRPSLPKRFVAVCEATALALAVGCSGAALGEGAPPRPAAAGGGWASGYILVQPRPGLSTAEVEALVTVPLEAAMNGVSWLKTLRSKSVLGLSSVVLIFADDTDRMRVTDALVPVEKTDLAEPYDEEAESHPRDQADAPRLQETK